MKIAVKRLLFEAYRRNEMACSLELSKPLNKRWLGLGTEAAYRPAIKEGLMTWFDGKVPPVRCMGWLVLTTKGIATIHSLDAEFSKRMKELNDMEEYKNSWRSQYQLAGGMTA